MTKTILNFALVAAVSLTAAAVSTPAFAAKKKAAAKVAACMAPASCRACANGVCNTQWCGGDGKWYPSPIFSVEPFGVSPKCR